MHKVEITDSSIKKALERSAADALNDPRADEAFIVGADEASPDAGCYEYAYSNEEEVSFAPYTTRGNEEDGTCTSAEQKVACQEGDSGEILREEERDGDGISGKNGAEGSSENAGETELKRDQVALP